MEDLSGYVPYTGAGRIDFVNGGYIDPTQQIGSGLNDLAIYAPDYLQLEAGYAVRLKANTIYLGSSAVSFSVGAGLITLNEDLAADNLSGTNTGDQTSIVGISGTKAEFDTACSDGDFLFDGDVDLTPYWKSDGTSTATGNWDIGAYNFTTTGNVNAQLFAGADDTSYGTNYIAIGNGAKSASTTGYDIAIGSGSLCSSYGGNNIAIGKNAITGSFGGGQVQIGTGTNTVAGTFQWRSWLLMDNSGHIPEARISNALGSYTPTDNSKSYYGTGKDASIYYNGTNFILNPKEVGSGYLHIAGQTLATDKIMFTQTDGNEYIDSLSDGNLDLGATTAINLRSDTIFVGSGTGLPYGEISAADASATQTITTTGKANKVQITAFDTNGVSNLCTPDHTNDHITIVKAGVYRCSMTAHVASVGAGGADNYGYSVYKNNGATEFTNLHGQRDLAGGGGDEGSISVDGLITLAANDTVEVWIWNNTNADDIVVDDINLNLIQVGG